MKLSFGKNLTVLILFVFILFLISYRLQNKLLTIYENENSLEIKDRAGKIVSVLPNQRGYFSHPIDKIPTRLKILLIQKEDKYFYYHFGFNPVSIFETALHYLGIGDRRASSTISQQLVKILLGKESERSLKNKIIEAFYTLSLEAYHSKNEILKMYANSIYFGNQAQGISEASNLYFRVDPEMLTDGQILQVLTTISSPTENNPAQIKNEALAENLAKKLKLDEKNLNFTKTQDIRENLKKYSHSSDSFFEISSFLSNPLPDQLTIDEEISQKIRKIVKQNIDELKLRNAKNAAVIVIKLPENQILTLIGSPDPQISEEGYKINMLKQPRPIGSTIKPFIYLKAFEKGLRPYTIIDDREYKYITALGFPLYPKNFDYKYRGLVSLHYALSNSLNVPAVKVLEYVGLQNFYNFLEKDLKFKPIQDLNNYQLGIALGALEMNLMDLARYFTIFPNNGVLKELSLYQGENLSPEKKISQPEYIQLVNKILNDRRTGIEQFGLKSELNLFQDNYALKTGTSRDFRDSWVIGYTPDFLVGVWVGNADNTKTEGVSGQIGAGSIWQQVMELLLNTEYNKKTPFSFNLIKEFYTSGNIEYGLAGDNYETAKNLLKIEDSQLILSPHNGDTFLLEENTQIILKAKENVTWFVNDEFFAEGESVIFVPQKEGQYRIEALGSNNQKEGITILILI